MQHKRPIALFVLLLSEKVRARARDRRLFASLSKGRVIRPFRSRLDTEFVIQSESEIPSRRTSEK